MSQVIFSRHSRDQLRDRGATEAEVREAILNGERVPAKRGRVAFRKNFSYRSEWKGKYYEIKQVMPIVIHEGNAFMVVTVYVFYFGGKE